ncbi:heterokaryon incompatibility protein-domain-containing protein [Lophiotrema nucula]|uniref:Heterokaryon incompatibility protein-domain-containing protein n=1 Tax=Lophiotrema nucula TaxID=690887 RepID=A0A6A5Z503_9PLEO|nr:heterokaryon incompatibility protein-domain-containing protein [Lophiotrema nucula]
MLTDNVYIVQPKDHVKGYCTPKAYPYDPLPSPTCVRLLQILPPPDFVSTSDVDKDTPIECSLKTVDLESKPKYTALSYTWSGPNIYYTQSSFVLPQSDWSCQCYTITINGHPVSISANLYAALIAIRTVRFHEMYKHSTGPLQDDLEYIWIDALCINQADLVEKSAQVQLMNCIYWQSVHVLVWLGGMDGLAMTAIPLLEKFAELGLRYRNKDGTYSRYKILPEFELDDPRFYEELGLENHMSARQWAGIFAFLNRAWFRRAWVVQELVLAKRAGFLCGMNYFGDGTLSRWLEFPQDMRMLSKLASLEPLLVHGSTLTEAQEERRRGWPYPPEYYTLYQSQEVSNWNSDMFTFINFVRQKMKADAAQSTLFPSMDGMAPLSQNLMLFRSCEATDPRDKIYAFLGISHHWTPLLQRPVVDYTLTPQQVYTAFTKHMIETETHFFTFGHIEDPAVRKMKDLPSWVPDYSTDCKPIPFRIPAHVGFCADRGLGRKHAAFPAPDILEVKAYRVNRIVALAYNSDLENAGISAIASFLSPLPRVMGIARPFPIKDPSSHDPSNLDNYDMQSRLDMLWRTTIIDSLEIQHPAPERLGTSMRISYRKALVHQGTSFIHNLQSVSDYEEGMREFSEANAAFETLLLPGEMKPLEKQLAEAEAGTLEGKMSFINLDGGDFWDKIPSEWLDLGDALPWEPGLESEFNYTKKLRTEHRKLAIIEPGGLGLVPESSEIDDEVWIIAGALMPVVLRPTSEEKKFRMIGEMYLHGMMHGEGMEGIDHRYLNIHKILLE